MTRISVTTGAPRGACVVLEVGMIRFQYQLFGPGSWQGSPGMRRQFATMLPTSIICFHRAVACV
jgi:hypothetical protein